MKKLTLAALVLILNCALYSQNINGKLGIGGQFIIRDTSNTFLTVSQNTGYLNLSQSLVIPATTSSSLGIIFKGGNRFLHNYGISNTFLGINTGNFTMTGSQNTVVGQNSLLANTSGFNNTVIGTQSLSSNTTGSLNTAVGWFTLGNNIGGDSNTAIGSYSLFNNTSGNFNTALGWSTGSTITTGNNLTCIGYNAQPSSGSIVNQITLGNNQITSLRCNVQTITSLSDARDKKNITDLSLGIDFLMKLKPRVYNWDKREWYDNNVSDGTKMQEAPTAGFIAQELDEAQMSEGAEWLNLVLKDNPEKLEATPGNLLPIVVKAIQELKAENDELKTENNELRERLSKLEQVQNMLAAVIEKMKVKNGEAQEVKLGENK